MEEGAVNGSRGASEDVAVGAVSGASSVRNVVQHLSSGHGDAQEVSTLCVWKRRFPHPLGPCFVIVCIVLQCGR